MASKKSGLGRGLDALFPDKKQSTSPKSLSKGSDEVRENKEKKVEEKKTSEILVPVNKIEPNLDQPRKIFNEDSLLELAESIKNFGVIQPLLVVHKKSHYEIIAGERRWRAAKLAGLKEVPVIIKDLTNKEQLEIALIENIQREDLNAVEEARAYKELIEKFNLKQDELALKVSKSRTAIANALRLLNLDGKILKMMEDEMISAGHGRAILGLNNKDLQISVANKIFDNSLSVRETENLVKALNNEVQKKPRVKKQKDVDINLKTVEEKLQEIIGTKVQIIKKTKKKGKIEIEYYSSEQLEHLIELLEGLKE